MGTVTIGGNSYEVYGDLAGAKLYLGAAVGQVATVWAALDDEGKSKLLVNAQRFLDAMPWQGTPTFVLPGPVATTLQWPRAGVVDKLGNPVSSTTVPAAIPLAEYELAGLVAVNPAILTAVDQGTNVEILRAGPVDVRYFRPTSAAAGTAPKYPPSFIALVGQYLSGGAASATAGKVSGACGHSSFDDCSQYKRTWPF